MKQNKATLIMGVTRKLSKTFDKIIFKKEKDFDKVLCYKNGEKYEVILDLDVYIGNSNYYSENIKSVINKTYGTEF